MQVKWGLSKGDTVAGGRELKAAAGADAIYCARQYQPWAAGTEAAINEAVNERGVSVKRYPGTLLHEPGSVLTGSGTAFKVFTPFWRAALNMPLAAPLPAPAVQWSDARLVRAELDGWTLDPKQQPVSSTHLPQRAKPDV